VVRREHAGDAVAALRAVPTSEDRGKVAIEMPAQETGSSN
jgi:hypothetical protein